MSVPQEKIASFAWALAMTVLWTATAHAGGEAFGSGALTEIQNWLTGPAAGTVGVIALAAGGVGLMFGRDFGQLAHTASYIALTTGMVGGAGSFIGMFDMRGGLIP